MMAHRQALRRIATLTRVAMNRSCMIRCSSSLLQESTVTSNDYSSSSSSSSSQRFLLTSAALLGALSATAMTLTDAGPSKPVKKAKLQPAVTVAVAHDHDEKSHGRYNNQPPPRPDLPTIPLDVVAEHCDEESMWFTFRGAVYDLTFFIHGHPGGTPVRFKSLF